MGYPKYKPEYKTESRNKLISKKIKILTKEGKPHKQAVAIAAIDTMSKESLSPQILKQQSERDGKVAQRLDSIERELDNIHRMHNGSHPPTQNKTKVS